MTPVSIGSQKSQRKSWNANPRQLRWSYGGHTNTGSGPLGRRHLFPGLKDAELFRQRGQVHVLLHHEVAGEIDAPICSTEVCDDGLLLPEQPAANTEHQRALPDADFASFRHSGAIVSHFGVLISFGITRSIAIRNGWLARAINLSRITLTNID